MKTNLDAMFSTDKELEKEGAIFDLGGGASMKVRRFNQSNPKMKAAFAANYKPYARQVDMGTLDPETDMLIRVKIFVDACLVSWDGVLAEDKSPVEFTRENAITILKGLPDLFEQVWKFANDFNTYKLDLGNS